MVTTIVSFSGFDPPRILDRLSSSRSSTTRLIHSNRCPWPLNSLFFAVNTSLIREWERNVQVFDTESLEIAGAGKKVVLDEVEPGQ